MYDLGIRPVTHQSVQPQKTAGFDLVSVFTYVKSIFSREEAHLLLAYNNQNVFGPIKCRVAYPPTAG